jgi:hypothetical protein
MTREVATSVAVILTSALEAEPELLSWSKTRLAIGGDAAKWVAVHDFLLHHRLTVIQDDTIILTLSGRKLAATLHEALDE